MKNYALICISIFLSQGVSAYQFTDSEIREMMVKVAQEYSKDLPITLDEETIWEGVRAGYERNIIYRYKLNSIKKDSDGLDYFKSLVSRKHKNNYCTTPELSIFRKEGVDIDHYFYSYEGIYLFSVKTSKNDC